MTTSTHKHREVKDNDETVDEIPTERPEHAQEALDKADETLDEIDKVLEEQEIEKILDEINKALDACRC